MESAPNISTAQRLAIEKQLLREEKFIVDALKTIKEERYALQRERADLLCLLQEVLNQGKPTNTQNQEQEGMQESELSTAEQEELDLPNFDDVASTEVELNLTVPTHDFYNQLPEEEYEEIETEDDFEIEMGMLMNGDKTETGD